MGKNVGHWNPIEPAVVSVELAGVSLQTWLALLIINPNKAGVFSLFPYDITGIVSKIRKAKTKKHDVKIALDDLEARGWIRRYPGNIVWIIDRWNYVSNRNNSNTIKNVESFVAPYPTVWADFQLHYGLQCPSDTKDTVSNTVSDTVNDSVGNKGKGEEEGEEEGDNSSDKSEQPLNPEYVKFVKELFPSVENGRAEKQAVVLDEIVRIDKMPFDELIPILRWGAKDDFWSGNFQSCAALRKRRHGAGDTMKWEKIKAAYAKNKPENRYYVPKNRR